MQQQEYWNVNDGQVVHYDGETFKQLLCGNLHKYQINFIILFLNFQLNAVLHFMFILDHWEGGGAFPSTIYELFRLWIYTLTVTFYTWKAADECELTANWIRLNLTKNSTHFPLFFCSSKVASNLHSVQRIFCRVKLISCFLLIHFQVQKLCYNCFPGVHFMN